MSVQPHRDPEQVVRRWDQVFEALSAEPRRQIVSELLDVPPDESVSLPGAAINPNLEIDRDQLRLSLYHHHLPVLERYEYVEWSPEPFRVSRGTNFDEIGVVIDSLHRNAHEIPDLLVDGCRSLELARQ